jgi:NAD(P)H-hydrate repair Nnr-like enzyme with NAD(P)H-hydrate dehydratase domain
MYMKLNINNTTSRPFSVSTIWDNSRKNKKIAAIIKEYSRLKNARKKEFVEQEIVTRIGIDVNSDPVDISKMPGQPGQAEGGGGDAMAAMMAAGAAPAEPIAPAPIPTTEATTPAVITTTATAEVAQPEPEKTTV